MMLLFLQTGCPDGAKEIQALNLTRAKAQNPVLFLIPSLKAGVN
jgi:hypothetical protein